MFKKAKFHGRTLKLAAIDPSFDIYGLYSPVANLFNKKTGTDLESLEKSIARETQIVPILRHKGKIIDGRARYEACLNLGIEPRFEDIPSTANPVHYCIAANMERRQLTDFDKIMVAAKMRMLPIGRNQSAESEALSQAQICEMFNIKLDSLQRGLKIIRHGTRELVAAVAACKISLTVGAQLAMLPVKKQNAIAKQDSEAIIQVAKGLNLLKIQKARDKKVQLTLMLNAKQKPLDGSIGRFSALLADPPWDYQGNDGTPYPTMKLQEILDMPVQDCCHDNAVLFLWVPNSLLPEGLAVIKAWGFDFKTSAVWDKQITSGQGAYFRQQHETLMVAIKGSMPQVDPMNMVSSIIRANSGVHSRKPAVVYHIIESMYPEFEKLELFSRNRRKGWTMWGNQAGESSADDTVDATINTAVGVVADAKAAVQASVDAAMQAVETGADPDFDVEAGAGTEVAKADEAASSRFNAYGVIETPDGELTFSATAGKATAAIQVAHIGNDWLAEYRYSFRCGDFQSTTLSLSAYSKPFPTKSAALVDAATRLIEDVTDERSASLKMPASQKKAKAELVAWAKSVIEANKPNPPVPPTTPVPPTKPLAGLNFVDLFAGVGGFHQALSQQGAKCVAVVEIDKPARETYLANYPGDYQVHCDIHDVVPESLPAFDILTGGFPCQSFSMAGDRLGYDDPTKGALFFEIVRIARARQPKVMILENVEGFMNHDGGRTADTAINELAKIGYTASMRVLNASEYGVPQLRKRVFIIAIRDDIYQQSGKHYVFPAGATPSKVVADILEPVTSEKFSTRPIHPVSQPSTETTSTILLGLIDGMHYQSYKVYSTLGQGTTLLASATSSLYLVDGQPRRLSAREYARMQGFPETFKLNASPRQAKKQMGNSVAVPVVSAIAETIADIINGAAVQAEQRPDASCTDMAVVIQP